MALTSQQKPMTNAQSQKVAAAYIRQLAAEAALADAERRSTGIVAARSYRAELTQAVAELRAAVAEVQS
jgi:hypothetical protein